MKQPNYSAALRHPVWLSLLLCGVLGGGSYSPALTAAETSPKPKVIPAIPLVPAPAQPGAANQPRVATLAVGAVAPDFVAQDEKGQTVRLSDHHGKVVVLDFWATWCGPCQKSLPHTQAVAKQYRRQGVVVMAVCTSDTRAKFDAWLKTNRAKYADLQFSCDPHDRGSATYDDRASKKLYGVTGIPTQFVIGREGKVVAVLVGYQEGDVRLEASLARAGITVDAALAAKGDAQLKQKE